MSRPSIKRDKEDTKYHGNLFLERKKALDDLERTFIVSGNFVEKIFLNLVRDYKMISDEKLRISKGILVVSLLSIAPVAKTYNYITRYRGYSSDYMRFKSRAKSGINFAEEELAKRGY